MKYVDLLALLIILVGLNSCGNDSPQIKAQDFHVNAEPAELLSEFQKCQDQFSADIGMQKNACDGRAQAGNDDNMLRQCTEEFQRLGRVLQYFMNDTRNIVDRFRKNCVMSGLAVMNEQTTYSYCDTESVKAVKNIFSPNCSYDVMIDKNEIYRWRIR